MIDTCKRWLCVILMMVFLFSIFCTGVPGVNTKQESKSGLSYPGLLYLEYVRNINVGSHLEQEASRQQFQARRRIPQRVNSLRISIPDLGKTIPRKTIAPREIGVLCMMIFLTVIIYIYRTDGKKRVLL